MGSRPSLSWGNRIVTEESEHNEDLASRLAEQEELLSSITANLPGVVYQFYARSDGDWGMHYVSQRAREIFGISSDPKTFVGEFISHLPEEDREEFIASIADVVERQAPWTYEGPYIRPDGQEIYFRANSIPRRRDGELVFDGLLLDITEQWNAERARFEQAEILRATAANIPGVVFQFAVREDSQLSLEYVSERASEIFKIESDSKNFLDTFATGIPDDERNGFQQSIALATRERDPWYYEGHFVRSDGAKMYFQGAAVPSKHADRTVFHGILMDQTDQQRIAEELKHTQKLDSLGQLAGGVAHDFNNMLGGIMGATELLQERLIDDSESRNLAEMVLETAERAGELTWQLLAFSRKGAYAKGPQSVHNLIRHTVQILERSIDPRIKIESMLGAERQMVIGDAGQLQAALLNLGVNARDAMPHGGHLRFETHVHLAKEKNDENLAPGHYLRIRVSDTGTGIPTDVVDRIFEPFFTTKDLGKGTGMGLAAVYGTVADHKGVVKLLKSSAEGTSFEVLLPLSGEAGTEDMPEPRSCSPDSATHVLLIDDEETVRVTARRLMESLGYQVTEARDGEEGIAIFREKHESLSLVVLDMTMPRVNGEDAFFAMKQLNRQVPVVLCSGNSADDAVARMRAGGLAGHLTKPFRRRDLGRALSAALSDSR